MVFAISLVNKSIPFYWTEELKTKYHNITGEELTNTEKHRVNNDTVLQLFANLQNEESINTYSMLILDYDLSSGLDMYNDVYFYNPYKLYISKLRNVTMDVNPSSYVSVLIDRFKDRGSKEKIL